VSFRLDLALLTRLREDKGWTQADLGVAVRRGAGTIKAYEEGLSDPQVGTLLAIAHLFGLHPQNLFISSDAPEAKVAPIEVAPRVVPKVKDPKADPSLTRRDVELIRRAKLGRYTLQELGEYAMISRERVRQILRRNGVSIGELRAEHKAAERAERQAARQAEIEAAKVDLTCPVCQAVFRRKPGHPNQRPCCSKECSEVIASSARVYISPEEYEKHRRSVARTVLKDPRKHSRAKVAHAKRVLSDDPPPANRRFRHRDSEASALAEEAGLPMPPPAKPSKQTRTKRVNAVVAVWGGRAPTKE
jgi:transcriptional regulator with XRE-family HTH domain